MQQGLDQFTQQLLNIDMPAHSKLTRSPAADASSTNSSRMTAPVHNPLADSIMFQLRKLMSTSMILRLADLLVYRVSTAKSRSSPKEFITGQFPLFPIARIFLCCFQSDADNLIPHFFAISTQSIS